MARPNYINQATEMFARFAAKHRLNYVVQDAPVEVLWEFPVQPGLSHRIVLGLQNNDELNFGVGGFWSYFFPFAEKQAEFETVIDKWIEGAARIVPKSGILSQTLELQVLEEGNWTTAYAACSLTLRKPAPEILTNKLK